jgi:hypothetical protein
MTMVLNAAGGGTYMITGVQILQIPGCSVREVREVNGDLTNVMLTETTFSALAPDPPDSDILLQGTVSGGRIHGTLSHPDGSGMFSVTKQ